MSSIDSALGSQRRRLRIAAAGEWLRRHRRGVLAVQWAVVGFYAFLLIVPAFLPLPGVAAHIWDNLTLFAQFVFWGIWWPGVLLSMLLFGRLWCGVFCPEGALSEFVSKRGRGGAIPRWIRWPGWPFAAFVLTTVYGQMVSVYQYPHPVLIVLGGSTLAAMAVGYFCGRGKRVWCRYLCPVSGVFGLLAKLAPVHFAVDRQAWDRCPPAIMRRQNIDCAPLVAVRTMTSASPCHMCGRCSGFRNAVALQLRHPNDEIETVSARTATMWDSLLILIGLLGIAIGAFQWASSPWFVAVKQWAALHLIEADILWPLETSLPWWILTNYPGQNDVLTILDGAVLLGYIAAAAVFLSAVAAAALAVAVRLCGPWRWQRFHHFAHALIPFAACGVILGLSAQTVTLLTAEGLVLGWVPALRALALGGAALWSLWLGWRIARGYGVPPLRAVGAVAASAAALAAPVASWVLLFWVW